MEVRSKQAGVTLIETVIGVAIMVMIAFSVYQAFAVLFDILGTSEARVQAAALANQEIEIIRNMPYEQVGLLGGVPAGPLAAVKTATKGNITFTVTTAIRNIDDPYDGTLGSSPSDTSPADYKLVELRLICNGCSDPTEFVFSTRVAPKALETASTNGALFIRVLNANGEPLQGATVQVTKSSAPTLNLTDVTDATGYLKIIDVLPAVQAYHIVVTKSGYSTDQTYASSTQNPNPLKPDATVAIQTVTQVSFAIDQLSTMPVQSLTNMCGAVGNINFSMSGAKLIGSSPTVLKYTQSFQTDSAGNRTVTNLEWDTYAFAFSNVSYDIAGMIPLSPISLSPGVTQNVKLIMEPKNPKGLLVTVKDNTTGLPLSNAAVTLNGPSYSGTLTTGRGFLSQTDWSGGSGQEIFINTAQYAWQNGNIETNSPQGEIELIKSGSDYVSPGSLTSSIFDTGSASNFYSLSWQPTSQPGNTGPESVRFQLATATTSEPMSWEYKGPDGTSSTYYTTANTNINAVHNGDRYLRYKIDLTAASSTFTPSIADVAVTFASDCVPPGQVFFSGLPGPSYTLTITRTGYESINDTILVGSSWQEYVASMIPST